MSEDTTYLKEVKSASGLKRVLEFEVPRDVVEAEAARMLEQVRKEARFDGFRPGKAPKDMVKAKFGRTAEKEAVERVIQQAFGKAIEDESLKPAAPATVTNLNFDRGGPLAFSLEIEILPEVEIATYKGIKIKRVSREAQDGEVDTEIENLRERFSTSTSVDREARSGDIVVIDYSRMNEEGKEEEGSKVTGFPFELGRQTVLKEFEEGLMGAKKGDSKKISVTYPHDFERKELRSKTVDFGVEVQEVKNRVLPELTDAFASRVGADSLLDLRLKVRESIQRMYDDDARAKMKAQVVQAIIEANPFEVPAAMVEASLDAMMESYKNEGAGEDEKLKAQLEEIREKMRPVAVNVVKEQFIIDEIAKREGIAVEQADLEEVISSFAERMNAPRDRVSDWANKSGEIRRWRYSIVRDKVLDFLLESAEVED